MLRCAFIHDNRTVYQNGPPHTCTPPFAQTFFSERGVLKIFVRARGGVFSETVFPEKIWYYNTHKYLIFISRSYPIYYIYFLSFNKYIYIYKGVTKNAEKRSVRFLALWVNIGYRKTAYPPLCRLPKILPKFGKRRFRYWSEFYFIENTTKLTMRNTRFSKCGKFCIFCNLLYPSINQECAHNALLVTVLSANRLLHSHS